MPDKYPYDFKASDFEFTTKSARFKLKKLSDEYRQTQEWGDAFFDLMSQLRKKKAIKLKSGIPCVFIGRLTLCNKSPRIQFFEQENIDGLQGFLETIPLSKFVSGADYPKGKSDA